MFAVDDYIIYGNYGVCKVEKIGTVSLPMVDKNKVYYTLRPVYKSEAVVYAPVENPKSINSSHSYKKGSGSADRGDSAA